MAGFRESDAQAPWGEASFRDDLGWFSRSPRYMQEEVREQRREAETNPTFDFFEYVMPTGKPKYDIGAYVAQHNVNVPLIRHMTDWQRALDRGEALLRSEMGQDYEGLSGLLDSGVVGKTPDPVDYRYAYENRGWESDPKLFDVYPQREYGMLAGKAQSNSLTMTINPRDGAVLDSLRDGTLSPTEFMFETVWKEQILDYVKDYGLLVTRPYVKPLYRELGEYGPITHQLFWAQASRWRYKKGVNLTVLRDPAIDGKYYIGARHPGVGELTALTIEGDLEDSVNVSWRFPLKQGGQVADKSIPIRKVIELYEKVRGLPLFDQTQAPQMEIQVGDDGKLYFLQYLKTGLVVNDPGAFSLPSGADVVRTNVVRGATDPSGEKLRLYQTISKDGPSEAMRGQALVLPVESGDFGLMPHLVATMARVAFEHSPLEYYNEHWDSSFISRPGVSITEHFRRNGERFHFPPVPQSIGMARQALLYYDVVITSNGREATIESDWEPKFDEPTSF